jgi:hypothetical protein
MSSSDCWELDNSDNGADYVPVLHSVSSIGDAVLWPATTILPTTFRPLARSKAFRDVSNVSKESVIIAIATMNDDVDVPMVVGNFNDLEVKYKFAMKLYDTNNEHLFSYSLLAIRKSSLKWAIVTTRRDKSKSNAISTVVFSSDDDIVRALTKNAMAITVKYERSSYVGTGSIAIYVNTVRAFTVRIMNPCTHAGRIECTIRPHSSRKAFIAASYEHRIAVVE